MKDTKVDKFLLVTGDFPPVKGGISTLLYELWKRIPPERSLVLTLKSPGCMEFDRQQRFKIVRTVRWPRYLRPLFLAVKSIMLIRKENIKVLLCGQSMTAALSGYLCKILFGREYFVYFYGPELRKYKGLWPSLISLLLKKADKIIAVSFFSKKEILKKVNLTEEKIIVLTPGVDTLRFHPEVDSLGVKERHNLKDRRVLLTVSRLDTNKGIDKMIKLLPAIRKKFPGVTYLIVGGGSEENYLKNLAAKITPESVIFVGEVSDRDLPAYYAVADMFILLTREVLKGNLVEGFGIVLLEASASQKPIIAGRTGGVLEAVVDKQTGLLVDPSNDKEIIKAIEKLLIDKSLAAKLAKEAREMVVRDFSWQKKSQRLMELLNR